MVSGLGYMLLMAMLIRAANKGPSPSLWRAGVPRTELLSYWGLGQTFICSAQTPLSQQNNTVEGLCHHLGAQRRSPQSSYERIKRHLRVSR